MGAYVSKYADYPAAKAAYSEVALESQVEPRYHILTKRSHTPMLWLPAELWSMIAEYLEPGDVLTWSVTCRIARVRLPLLPLTQAQLVAFRKKDYLDENPDLGPEMALCSACLDVHHAASFSKAQLIVSASARLCITAEKVQRGRIRLCQHKTVSRSQLEKIHPFMRPQGERSCLWFDFNAFRENIDVYNDATWCFGSCGRKKHANFWVDGVGSFRMQSYILFDKRRPSEQVTDLTFKDIMAFLESHKYSYCPHVQEDQETISNLAETMTYRQRGRFLDTSVRLRCKEPHCKTYIWIHSTPHSPNHLYSMDVDRNLGQFKDRSDPRWLAQVQLLPFEVVENVAAEFGHSSSDDKKIGDHSSELDRASDPLGVEDGHPLVRWSKIFGFICMRHS